MKRVKIHWLDIHTRDGWEGWDAVESDHKEEFSCKTIGWLLAEDKKRITVCHTINKLSVMGRVTIPKGCIKKIKRYK